MNLRTGILTASIAAPFAWAAPASAHCDALDGPIVSAACKALDTGDIDLVLAWTQKYDDKEIRNAFENARAVRKAGGQS